MDLRGKRILVMGLGVHGGGLGAARWLLRQGARVTVTDMASPEALAAPLAQLNSTAAQLGTSLRYTLGEHRTDDFTSSDLVVVNPAVRPDSPWLALCRQTGVPIETEMTLFFRVCPGPILGVTGTKGKTTTALMLAAMLREAFPDTVAAGNLRVSALEALETITAQTPVVLELSSFQLERLGEAGLSPRYSLITNLSGDHINWHGSMAAYARAKAQIFAHQGEDGVVVGSRESGVGSRGGAGQGRVIYYDATPGAETEARITADGRLVLGEETLAQVSDIRLPGAHSRANALAAAALARSFGVSPTQIATALRGFAGVEHRLELVRELDGVHYVNDTTATNPAAALAGLEAITTPIVLIAGGADKDLEFAELGRAIAQRVRALVLLEGSATARLTQAIADCKLQIVDCRLQTVGGPYGNFEQAILAARGMAEAGDTVLLSPGCASFGMFRNEFHRGEEFRRIVNGLGPGDDVRPTETETA
ncbi:UDP-N-acetylmuramoyl-L-alanine--D-glutamate ligase [Chloroflexales bacterium ZM16-3]|nr:UDP-N-acetylmuramoyl-L-alanine--D-glutamate ligase [Chloroflexales bacterium ZM16-3]